MAIEYMKSVRTINDVTLTFSKITNTTIAEGPITRRIVITTGDDSVTADFTESGFDLLKALIREY
jgi:hypothetical protein